MQPINANTSIPYVIFTKASNIAWCLEKTSQLGRHKKKRRKVQSKRQSQVKYQKK